MRTTLTLDPDVARMLDEEMHRQRRPFKQVVNDAIRKGLSGQRKGTARFRIRSHECTLAPGIDPGSLNALADELEDEEILTKA